VSLIFTLYKYEAIHLLILFELKKKEKREILNLRKIGKTFNILATRKWMEMKIITLTLFGFQQLFCFEILSLDL
jgi:hypothetical protein